MIADKRLNTLTCCTATNNKREVLKSVHIHDNHAEATDGHILARCKFDICPDDEYPETPGEPLNGDHVLLSKKQITDAFKVVPKKTKNPVLQNVKVGINRGLGIPVIVSTNLETTNVTQGKCSDETFPNCSMVWPMFDKDESVIAAISVEMLEKLVKLVKESDLSQKYVVLQVKDTHSAVKFVIPSSEPENPTYKGLVMPIREGEDNWNIDKEEY